MIVKAEKININEEYEKILPPTERKSLFDESEDYDSFREYIMAQPYIFWGQKKLPFAEIELIDYVDFMRIDAIDKATTEHKHLFFIKQSEKGNPYFCDAAGYYKEHSKNFVVMPFSYIVATANGCVPYPAQRMGEENMNGINRYTTCSLNFVSPGDAATFVLGENSRLEEWVDIRGKGLSEYYPEFAIKPVENFFIFSSSSPTVVGTVSTEKHIFKIFVKGKCKARGYYDEVKGHFYILKDSLLTLNVDSEFEKSALGIARNRMIASVCTRNAHYYIVNRDTKCRSASVAATYVLGKEASYVEWEDEKGESLKDFFPKRFSRKKEKSVSLNTLSSFDSKTEAIRLFYIKKEGEPGRECNALGYFDEKTKTFILKEGSKWASEVTKGYQFTASEFLRRNHIKRNCKVIGGAIFQSRDILCNTPSSAASFVLGRVANGWEEWTDKDGFSLKCVYKDNMPY